MRAHRKMNLAVCHFCFCVTLLVTISYWGVEENCLFAQSISVSSTSDSVAITTIEKAITALGGRGAWNAVGAASATVLISKKGIPDHQVTWSDDWSSGHNQSRRNFTDPAGHRLSMTQTHSSRTLRGANGTLRTIRNTSDITSLAESYPGAALSISLKRKDCRFSIPNRTQSEGSANEVIVIATCDELFYPQNQVVMVWTFSKVSSLPVSVQYPIVELVHNQYPTEIASFVDFKWYGSLLQPSTIQVRRISGNTDTLQLTSVVFTDTLPSETFDTAR